MSDNKTPRKRDWRADYVQARTRDAIAQITVGGVAHKTLLAMRATGRIEVKQLTERLGDPARALVVPGGPLCARKTLQTYCQL